MLHELRKLILIRGAYAQLHKELAAVRSHMVNRPHSSSNSALAQSEQEKKQLLDRLAQAQAVSEQRLAQIQALQAGGQGGTAAATAAVSQNMQQQLNALRADRNTIRGQYGNLQKSVDQRLKNALAEREKTLRNGWNSGHTAELAMHAGALAAKQQELDAAIGAVKQAAANRNINRQEAVEALQTMTAERNAVTVQLQDAVQRYEGSEAKRADLQQQLEAGGGTAADLAKLKAQMAAQQAAVTDTVQSLVQERDALQALLNTGAKGRQNAENQVANWSQKFAALQGERNALAQNRNALTGQVAEWSQKYAGLQVNRNSAAKNRNAMRAQFEASQDQMTAVAAQLATVQAELSALTTERNALKVQFNGIAQSSPNQTGKLAEIAADLAASKTESAQLKQEYADLQAKYIQLEAQCAATAAAVAAPGANVPEAGPAPVKWREYAEQIRDGLKKAEFAKYAADPWGVDFAARYNAGTLTNANARRVMTQYMDMFGTVYTLVVINKHSAIKSAEVAPELEVQPDGRQIVMNGKLYGKFTSIFRTISGDPEALGRQYEQLRVGSSSLPELITMTLSGASASVFGYGFSGSGKTRSLLGDTANPNMSYGLLALMLEDISRSGAEISLEYVFELYGKILTPALLAYQPRWKPAGRTTDLIGVGASSVKARDFKDFITPQVITLKNGGQPTSIPQMIAEIDQLLKMRVTRATPNNPASSRSHAFMMFKVRKDGQTGYLTAVDMAGSEDSFNTIKNLMLIGGAAKGKVPEEHSIKNAIPSVLYSAGPMSEGYGQSAAADAKGMAVTAKQIWTKAILDKKLPFLADTTPFEVLTGFALRPGMSKPTPKLPADIGPNTFTDNYVQVHNYPKVATTLLEGYFVAQTLVDLQIFLKWRNHKKPAVIEKEFLDVNHSWITPVFTSQQKDPIDGDYARKYGPKSTFYAPSRLTDVYDGAKQAEANLQMNSGAISKAANIRFQDLLSRKAGFTTKDDFDPTLMTTLLRTISQMGSQPSASFMTMLTVVNPLVPYGATAAAQATLEFASSVSA